MGDFDGLDSEIGPKIPQVWCFICDHSSDFLRPPNLYLDDKSSGKHQFITVNLLFFTVFLTPSQLVTQPDFV